MANTFTSYKMEERSYVSYVKREIHNQVVRAHFSERQVGEIDIIVSELTSNLIKHAGQGELLVRVQDLDEATSRIEVVSIDNGPGIADTARMQKDGVSTTHTLGHGLGAINRLSNLSQLYSIPGWGTVVYSMVKTKTKKSNPAPHNGVEVRALCVNKPREEVCGDGFAVKRSRQATSIFFGDGLGHGKNAKTAVDIASDFFYKSRAKDPVEMIRQLHQNIRRTRGLVGVVAVAELTAKQWQICGVGNISSRIYSGIGYKNYMSYNGTIGLTIPNSMNATTIPFEPNQHLVSYSDGIQSRWDLSKYPAILKYDNIILAAAIYKDHSRGNDDSSILVAKVH